MTGLNALTRLKEHYVGNCFIDCPDPHAARRAPGVAAQQELGLLPERRTGTACGCPDCPAFAGQDLKRVGLCSVGTPCPCYRPVIRIFYGSQFLHSSKRPAAAHTLRLSTPRSRRARCSNPDSILRRLPHGRAYQALVFPARWTLEALEGAWGEHPIALATSHNLFFLYETQKSLGGQKPKYGRCHTANCGCRLGHKRNRFCTLTRRSGQKGLLQLCQPRFTTGTRGAALAGSRGATARGTQPHPGSWFS